MNFRNVSDLTDLILRNFYKIPKDVDLIVGIPRSGMLVANYISLLSNKPLTDLDGFLEGRILASGRTKNTFANKRNVKDCKKILIVDDSVSSGESLQECKRKVAASDVVKEKEIIYCAAIVLPSSKDLVDIYFEILSDPRIFEWNLFHQPGLLPKMCFDIDGILCRDPLPSQNDDGPEYRKFILNADANIIPSGCIGSLVTSRLEKYRKETEQWLSANNVSYEKLIMLNATAEERANMNLHAKFKADYYGKSEYILFIESEEKQAIEICNLTGKPVYCLENNQFYQGNVKYELKFETKSRIRGFLRKSKLLRKIYRKIKR